MSASYKIPKTATPTIVSLLVTLYNSLRDSLVSTNIHSTSTPEGDADDLENPSPTVLSVADAAITPDVDAIVTALATSTSAVELTGAELTGVLGGSAFTSADYVTATLSSTAGAFTDASTITVTGTYNGATVTDVLTISGTDGNATLWGDQLFDSVTQIDIEAQADTDGTISIGRAYFPELCTRTNRIKGVLNAHFADTLAHNTAVSAAISTADATTLATGLALATAAKTAYGTHRTASNVHFNNDATNTISAADATTLATWVTLVNELRTDVAAHIAASLSGSHIELV